MYPAFVAPNSCVKVAVDKLNTKPKPVTVKGERPLKIRHLENGSDIIQLFQVLVHNVSAPAPTSPKGAAAGMH
jgi:hypothetical protein